MEDEWRAYEALRALTEPEKDDLCEVGGRVVEECGEKEKISPVLPPVVKEDKENELLASDDVCQALARPQRPLKKVTEEVRGFPIDEWREGAKSALQKAVTDHYAFQSLAQLSSRATFEESERSNRFTIAVLANDHGSSKLPKQRQSTFTHWEMTNLTGTSCSLYLPSPWTGPAFGKCQSIKRTAWLTAT
jgi:hypothetical protein